MRRTPGYLVIICAFTFMSGCEKRDNQRLFDELYATITPPGGTSTTFNASSVDDQELLNMSSYAGNYRIQLTANGKNDEYITISFVYSESVPSTYDITSPLNESNVICAYHKAGASSDDVAVSGKITADDAIVNPFDASEHKVTGTFDFVTASGIHVTGGYACIF